MQGRVHGERAANRNRVSAALRLFPHGIRRLSWLESVAAGAGGSDLALDVGALRRREKLADPDARWLLSPGARRPCAKAAPIGMAGKSGAVPLEIGRASCRERV